MHVKGHGMIYSDPKTSFEQSLTYQMHKEKREN